MTTPEAAARYEREYLERVKDKRYAVYNPHNRPIEELPFIYGFNNGGNSFFLRAQLIAEDGVPLGSHGCSSECYMPGDLGVLEGTRSDRHEHFQKHYPDGYRMTFVSYDDVEGHEGLQAAFKANEALDPALFDDSQDAKVNIEVA